METAPLPYGLVPGDTVRYQKTHGGRWYELHVRGVNTDGSLSCFEVYGRRAARSLHADKLEVRRRGPRGGTVWHPLTNGDADDDPTSGQSTEESH